jgi:curli biogenesis system outer membrane secretion channel CsgG
MTLFFFSSSQAVPATRPTVIVVGFDIPVPGFKYEENLPNALTDLMINALINSNRFRVFERRKLETLVQEQNFQHFSGLVDPETAVQLGKMIGANFVVTGSITGLSCGGGEGFKLGPVTVGSASTRVTLTVRIVDVTTGEILYSTVEEKKASRSQFGIQLPVVGGLGAYSQTSQDIITTVNSICEKVVATFVSKMDEGVGSLATVPVEGYVVDVSGSTIYINLGKDTGIKVGDLVRIYRPGKTIVDPKTKKVLDQQLTLIAQARVTRVKMNLSEVMIIGKSGSGGEIRLEDIVEVVSSSDESMIPIEESHSENLTDQENRSTTIVSAESEKGANDSSPPFENEITSVEEA